MGSGRQQLREQAAAAGSVEAVEWMSVQDITNKSYGQGGINILTIEEIQEKEALGSPQAKEALDKVIGRVCANVKAFGDKFPGACSVHNHYEKTENDDWTDGFYTGMIWLAYEETGNKNLEEAALKQVDSFEDRMNRRVVVDHHDMGFLYTPSCEAAYKLAGSIKGRDAALAAADNLVGRFREKGQFFQAWGKVGDSKEYRLIIDCLMNLPLLFWATEVTGEEKYADYAGRHIETALKVLIRDDFSSFHTFFFDPATGAPLRGATHQGNRNDSVWARGQAWAVYGAALAFAKTGKSEYREIFRLTADYFLTHLPKDLVPYWDFDFQDGSEEPRDSSAAAIAACGLLEMARHVEENEKKLYRKLASVLLKSLTDNCLYRDMDETNGILLHATYSQGKKDGKLLPGADECTLWGDYFYMEALVRLTRDWKPYW